MQKGIWGPALVIPLIIIVALLGGWAGLTAILYFLHDISIWVAILLFVVISGIAVFLARRSEEQSE